MRIDYVLILFVDAKDEIVFTAYTARVVIAARTDLIRHNLNMPVDGWNQLYRLLNEIRICRNVAILATGDDVAKGFDQSQ